MIPKLISEEIIYPIKVKGIITGNELVGIRLERKYEGFNNFIVAEKPTESKSKEAAIRECRKSCDERVLVELAKIK